MVLLVLVCEGLSSLAIYGRQEGFIQRIVPRERDHLAKTFVLTTCPVSNRPAPSLLETLPLSHALFPPPAGQPPRPPLPHHPRVNWSTELSHNLTNPSTAQVLLPVLDNHLIFVTLTLFSFADQVHPSSSIEILFLTQSTLIGNHCSPYTLT